MLRTLEMNRAPAGLALCLIAILIPLARAGQGPCAPPPPPCHADALETIARVSEDDPALLSAGLRRDLEAQVRAALRSRETGSPGRDAGLGEVLTVITGPTPRPILIDDDPQPTGLDRSFGLRDARGAGLGTVTIRSSTPAGTLAPLLAETDDPWAQLARQLLVGAAPPELADRVRPDATPSTTGFAVVLRLTIDHDGQPVILEVEVRTDGVPSALLAHAFDLAPDGIDERDRDKILAAAKLFLDRPAASGSAIPDAVLGLLNRQLPRDGDVQLEFVSAGPVGE